MKKASKSVFVHIERLNKLAERLENTEGKIAQIDIDMMLEELRSTYETVYNINTSEEPCASEQEQRCVEEEKPVAQAVVAETIVDAGTVIAEATQESTSEANAVEEPAYEAPSIEELTAEEAEAEVTAEGKDPDTTTEETNGSEEPLSEAETLLLTDTDAEPQYAEETESATTTPETQTQTLDDLEGNPNDELFAETPDGDNHDGTVVGNVETAISSDSKSEDNPVVIGEALSSVAPQTILDKLQNQGGSTTLADKIGATTGDTPKKESQPTPQPSLFDYFKNSGEGKPSKTIADTLGETKATDAEGRLHANKVADLRTIININDKFSFMNELFHNNMKGYNDFILRLNAIEGREEALAYVASIAQQYEWDNESMAVKTFYTIFDRKF